MPSQDNMGRDPSESTALVQRKYNATPEEQMAQKQKSSICHGVLANVAAACPGHKDCRPRLASTLQATAKSLHAILRTFDVSVVLNKFPYLADTWVDGILVVRDYANGKLVFEDCVFCSLEEILLGPATVPILTGFLMLGKRSQFTRVTTGLVRLGEEEEVIASQKRVAEALCLAMATKAAE